MSDARIAQWLEATSAALAAPTATRVAALIELEGTRARLEVSLRERPPEPIPAALAQELATAEQSLFELAQSVRAQFTESAALIRQGRRVVEDYRPSHPNRPAFVSKSV